MCQVDIENGYFLIAAAQHREREVKAERRLKAAGSAKHTPTNVKDLFEIL